MNILRGHPHNYTKSELKYLDDLSKKLFTEQPEIIESEKILENSELKNEIEKIINSRIILKSCGLE